MSVNSTKLPVAGAHGRSTNVSSSRRAPAHSIHPSDDEILGLVTRVARPAPDSSESVADAGAPAKLSAAREGASSVGSGFSPDHSAVDSSAQAGISSELAQILEAHPQLREAVDAAQQFRAIFPTPAAAQDAKQQLDELDAMFFSAQSADHAALAARIHELSPSAFHGLAQAMQSHAADAQAASSGSGPDSTAVAPGAPSFAAAVKGGNFDAPAQSAVPPPDPRRAAQLAFFHSANAAAVQQIVSAIESQVNHLLPEGVSAGAKTRIVGEIYRDLEAALRANRQLGNQLREVFRAAAGANQNTAVGSGFSLPAVAGPDLAAHQQAIVALLAGRAKQALPSIAKRVIGEWTHGVVAANRERLARHDHAAKHVDISGAGASDGVNRKPISPREVDYKRLSDSDILNL